jgi:guanylate kinase
LLIVICGPSGVGKTTLCQRLQEVDIGRNLVTCTTREARSGEKNGEQYHFLSDEEFTKGIAANSFVEHAQVHGFYYGIRRGDIVRELEANKTMILNIDVQGAATLRELFPETHLDIFIDASIETLKKRLEKRSKDSAEVIAHRLSEAEGERARKHEFSKILINEDLDTCYEELKDFINAYRKEEHV